VDTTIMVTTKVGILLLCVTLSVCQTIDKKVVNEAVIDLRAQPDSPASVNFGIDRLQLTQLLYNEAVLVYRENNGWSYVMAVDQPNYVNNTWTGYSGWVESSQLSPVGEFPNYNLVVKSHYATIYSRSCANLGCLPSDEVIKVSMGTMFEGVEEDSGYWKITLPNKPFGYILASAVRPVVYGDEKLSSYKSRRMIEQDIRSDIIETGKTLLGVYYFWGGRSAFSDTMYQDQTQLTGTDCSGFVSLSYKANGIIIPRDAHIIFLKTHNVTSGPLGPNLQPGDVLFFAETSRPDHMTHVMMVVDDGHIMESTVNVTRFTTYKTRFGVDFKDLMWGKPSGKSDSLVYWGTLFPWRDIRQLIRF